MTRHQIRAVRVLITDQGNAPDVSRSYSLGAGQGTAYHARWERAGDVVTSRPRSGDVYDSRSLSSYFRRKRDRLLRTFILQERQSKIGPFRILDVGGTSIYWQRVGLEFLAQHDIEVLCVSPGLGDFGVGLPRVTVAAGDGMALDFPDLSFDLVHSNSVIEHVGRSKEMQHFAAEVRRLAPAYYIQTPNFWFPVEPHFYRVPMFHWLPRPLRVELARRWRIGLHPPSGDYLRALRVVEYAVLLDRRLFCALFPDANIATERFALLPKSLIALRSSTSQYRSDNEVQSKSASLRWRGSE